MLKLELDEASCILIRNLIDLGIKTGGLRDARQLVALDDKIVAAGQVFDALHKKPKKT